MSVLPVAVQYAFHVADDDDDSVLTADASFNEEGGSDRIKADPNRSHASKNTGEVSRL